MKKFENKNLSVLAYANGFTLWHYKNEQHFLSEILSEKYFKEVIDLIHDGDIMLINAKDGTGFRCVACVTHEEITWKTLS